MDQNGSSDTHLSGCVSQRTVRMRVLCQVKVGSGKNAYANVCAGCLHNVFRVSVLCVCVRVVKDRESARASDAHSNG